MLGPLLLRCSSHARLQTVSRALDLTRLAAVRNASQRGVWAAWARAFADLPPHTELQMPALSPTMSQGNLTSWRVKAGDELEPGTILAEIETDKATLEWENQDDGFVAKLLVEAGAKDVAVGSPLAVLVESKDDVAAFKDYSPSSSQTEPFKESQPGPESKESGEQQAAGGKGPPAAEANTRIGPAAKKLLQECGLSLDSITPSGPRGIVTKGDVLAAISGGQKPAKQQQQQPQQQQPQADKAQQPEQKQQQAAPKQEQQPEQKPSPPAPKKGQGYTDIPNSQIRKIIAKRLLESKQTVPHLYLRADADLDPVSSMRESMKLQGTKVSLNDFIVRAVALALAEVPAANASWDVKSSAAVPGQGVDIAIAVATDKGLITPIVKGADKKSLMQISAEVKDLAKRARANKLKPDEFQGGSFSISNLGMFGIDYFSAIINPPQACIMAVGGTRHRVLLKDGQPQAKTHLTVTLSADHRVYDGDIAGAFLGAFCKNMANPVKLLL